jgi:hypothetical protein
MFDAEYGEFGFAADADVSVRWIWESDGKGFKRDGDDDSGECGDESAG